MATDKKSIHPFLPIWLYNLIQGATGLMVLFIPIILWPSNPLGIPGRLEFASGYCAALLALVLFLTLMRSIPETFRSLWVRGAVSSRSAAPPKKARRKSTSKEERPYEYLDPDYPTHVNNFEDALNSRGQWGMAILFAALVLWWYLSIWGRSILASPILLVGGLVEPLIGIILGVMAWRMVMVGWEVSMLPMRYNINVLVTHPDRCGGLSPIGNLCLLNALIIAVAGIHLGGWSLFSPNYPYTQLIIVPLGLSIFAFVLPMLTIHEAMEREKQDFQTQLDELSHRINHEDRQLLEAGDYIDPARGEKWLSQIELMSKLFDQHRSIPTWPVNWAIFGKFLAAEAIPILSLFGTSKSILDIVKGLVDALKP